MMKTIKVNKPLEKVLSDWFNTSAPKGYCCFIMYKLLNSPTTDNTYFKDNDGIYIEFDYTTLPDNKEHHIRHKLTHCSFCGAKLN